MRHLIGIEELSVEEIENLISTAEDIIANPKKYNKVAEGKKIATLFYEPSTRTRLSFESAMMRLGGKVLGCTSLSPAEWGYCAALAALVLPADLIRNLLCRR